jgi:hypothetical protein
MISLTEKIKNLFNKDTTISLKRGGPYFYIGEAPTKINGKVYEVAFEYKLSEKNKKRVTRQLIDSIYNFYKQNGRIPERLELKETFNSELKSRPCNYSVAKFIVEQLIIEDNSLQS